MPKKDDTFKIELKDAHTKWGTHRHTKTREPRKGEAYIPIPRDLSKKLDIFNSNKKDASIEYKISIKGNSDFLINAKATGSSKAGDIYAKQFSGSNNLKKIGKLYQELGVKSGDEIKLTFKSNNEIEIEKL